MYRVGVDLGGTNIVAGVINEEMKIIGRGKLKTNCPRAAEAILEDVDRKSTRLNSSHREKSRMPSSA